MNNFIYENKTKVYFGKGGVKEYLCCLLKNVGDTVMLAYGGGSIKKNGIYDEVTAILQKAGKTVVDFSGIMSNPTYAKVQEGATLARDNSCGLYPCGRRRLGHRLLQNCIGTDKVDRRHLGNGNR